MHNINNQEHHDSKMYTEIELLKRDNVQLKEILTKLDVSVEKIADAASNISKILALHEQRVQMLVEDVHTMKQTKESIIKDSKDLEERVSKLEQYRWYIIGVVTAATFIINKLPNIFSK